MKKCFKNVVEKRDWTQNRDSQRENCDPVFCRALDILIHFPEYMVGYVSFLNLRGDGRKQTNPNMFHVFLFLLSYSGYNGRENLWETGKPVGLFIMHGKNVEFGNLIPGKFGFWREIFAILMGNLSFRWIFRVFFLQKMLKICTKK